MTEHRSPTIEARPHEVGLQYEEGIAASRAAFVDSIALSLELRGASADLNLAGLDVTKRWSVKAAFLRLDAPELDQHGEVTGNDSRFSIGLNPLKPGLYLVWTWVEHAGAPISLNAMQRSEVFDRVASMI